MVFDRDALPFVFCFCRASLALGGALVLFGCGAVRSTVAPGGGHYITCENGMSACITKAAKICGDDGYTIRDGASRPRMLGGSSSSHRSMSEEAELTIVCGLEAAEEDEPKFKLPPRSDEPEPEPAEEIAPGVPAACTPGATQKCVGPGACEGGQVCLATGAGFGACDCGSSSSSSSSSPAPAASPEAPVPPSHSASPDGPSTLRPREGDKGPHTRVPGAAPAPQPLSQ